MSKADSYLAIHLPWLPVEQARARYAWPAEAAAATVARRQNRPMLAAVDRPGLALGLAPGLPLADARARIPDLLVVDESPQADHALLARLARLAGAVTPTVVIDPPDGLLLDIGGSAHLFGGAAALGARLAARLARHGLTVRTGLAGNPAAARAFARFGRAPGSERAAITALPVAALGLPPEGTLALQRAGLDTIGSLATRPRAALAARFGTAAITALDRLLGAAPAPLTPALPPAPLVLEERLPEPILATPQALLVLDRLLARACRRLERRRLGGRIFEAFFDRTDGIRRMLTVSTSCPTRDPALARRLFAERIESLADPIDPGFGFDRIALAVPLMEPLAAEQFTHLADRTAGTAFSELVDRLSIRLGPDRVQQFQAIDSHIPERRAQAVPAISTPAPADWPATPAGEPPARPLLLFEPPQPIDVVAAVPDGPPHSFRWHHMLHAVVRAEGPERIAAEWWRRAPGRPGRTRDYYRVEDSEGRRFWLFRHGLYEQETDAPAWYLHGLFA